MFHILKSGGGGAFSDNIIYFLYAAKLIVGTLFYVSQSSDDLLPHMRKCKIEKKHLTRFTQTFFRVLLV